MWQNQFSITGDISIFMVDFSVSSMGDFSVSRDVSSLSDEEVFGMESMISISDNVFKLSRPSVSFTSPSSYNRDLKSKNKFVTFTVILIT